MFLNIQACSQKPSESSVHTAIAETQAIQSAIAEGISQTQIPIIPTATAKIPPIVTPSPTATQTSTPEPTSTPRQSLANVMLTYEDLVLIDERLATLWQPPEELPCSIMGDVIDCYYIWFKKAEIYQNPASMLYIHLKLTKSHEKSAAVSAQEKKYEIDYYHNEVEELSIPSNADLPDNAWLMKTGYGKTITLSFYLDEIIFRSDMGIFQGFTAEDLIPLFIAICEEQLEKLNEAGYYLTDFSTSIEISPSQANQTASNGLADAILSYTDISKINETLAGYLLQSPEVSECKTGDLVVECHWINYQNESFPGNGLHIALNRADSTEHSKIAIQYLKATYSDTREEIEIPSPSQLGLPDNAWLLLDEANNTMILGYSYSQIFLIIGVPIYEGFIMEEISAYIIALGVRQLQNLKNAGYDS